MSDRNPLLGSQDAGFQNSTLHVFTYSTVGILMAVGSAFYFPEFDEKINTGSWLFVAACAMLLIAMLSAARFDFASSALTVVGAGLLLLGSFFFGPVAYDMSIACWLTIVGAAAFAAGQGGKAKAAGGGSGAALVHTLAAFSGLAAIVATSFFLPRLAGTDAEQTAGAMCYMVAGTLFFASAVALVQLSS